MPRPSITSIACNRWTLILAAVAVVASVYWIFSNRLHVTEGPQDPPASMSDYRYVALQFAKLLAQRDYAAAYTMTSRDYRLRMTVEQLQTAFEKIIPADWGPIEPIEVGATMTHWPDKHAADIGWAYVSLGGNLYSEAIVVIVTTENGESKIREVEFGRP